MELFLSALAATIKPSVLLFTFVGICLGLFIGAMPGLTATMGVAILLPITFWLEPDAGLGMLFGILNSAIFAGGISAILLNMPGTPASIASTFDGYHIAKRGEARLALWINTVFSVMGGLVGITALALLSFPIAHFALQFGPPEYTMLGIFGLSMMIAVSGKSVLKGVMVGLIGLGIAMIGMDPIWAVKRYTFGQVYLLDGISFIPIMIGLFGVGESLRQLSERRPHSAATTLNGEDQQAVVFDVRSSRRKRLTFKEFWQMKWAMLVTFACSIWIGALPGAGGDVAGIVSWTQARNISKDRENYGKGSLEGLAVSCAANNCCIGGDLTCMLSLGVPGDSVTAILIGALMMYNYTPGPLLFAEHKDMVYAIIILNLVCNLMILFVGGLSSTLFAKFIELPKSWIATTVIAFSLVGSYAISNSPIDVVVCFASGILGFLMMKADFPTGPLVLALILGRLVESNLSRSMLLSKGDFTVFLRRPISLALLLFTVSALVWPEIKRFRASRKDRGLEHG